MTLSVRPATPADHQAAAHVYTHARPGNPATAALLAAEDIAQAQAGAIHARWLAEVGGQVIGAAEIMEPLGSRAPGSVWLELVVLTEWRGQGAATALARALKAELSLHAPTRIKAVVSEANPVALRFAQKHGFAEVERFWDRTLELSGFDAARHARPLPEGIELVTLKQFTASVPDVGLVTVFATPSEVIEATTAPGTSVPRGMKPTDRMLGSDTPIRQAIIHTQI